MLRLRGITIEEDEYWRVAHRNLGRARGCLPRLSWIEAHAKSEPHPFTLGVPPGESSDGKVPPAFLPEIDRFSGNIAGFFAEINPVCLGETWFNRSYVIMRFGALWAVGSVPVLWTADPPLFVRKRMMNLTLPLALSAIRVWPSFRRFIIASWRI